MRDKKKFIQMRRLIGSTILLATVSTAFIGCKGKDEDKNQTTPAPTTVSNEDKTKDTPTPTPKPTTEPEKKKYVLHVDGEDKETAQFCMYDMHYYGNSGGYTELGACDKYNIGFTHTIVVGFTNETVDEDQPSNTWVETLSNHVNNPCDAFGMAICDKWDWRDKVSEETVDVNGLTWVKFEGVVTDTGVLDTVYNRYIVGAVCAPKIVGEDGKTYQRIMYMMGTIDNGEEDGSVITDQQKEELRYNISTMADSATFPEEYFD